MTYSEEQYNAILAVCRSYKNDYDRAFERLKEQQQEIERLKAENEKYLDSIESVQAGRCRLRCQLTEQAVKQAKIDVLNELRNRLVVYYPSVISVIDELIKEVENAEDKS